MTENEAINELLDYVGDVFKTTISVEAITLARKALEKQIPKKPLIEYHCGLENRCPTCNCEVSDIEHRKWSCKCGQKLDWSER